MKSKSSIMTASSRSSGPRYAPEDPTLPKPWKKLIDGSTEYPYYWNPETNVTQYERPVSESLPPPPPGPPPLSRKRDRHDDDRHYRSRSYHQSSKPHAVGHASSDVGYVSKASGRDGAYVQSSKTSAKGHGSADVGGSGSSAEAYRRKHEITITGDDVPPPYTTFESTQFSSEILREVHHAGFPAPTPIQAQSWPIALRGRDVVAVAKTGSGKTLGYLFPGFSHIKNLRNNCKLGPTVLVLAPTRELATQIQVEAEKFGRTSRISCTCLYGGAPKGPQLRDLDRGVDVVVATPGRLNDILEMRRVSLRQVSYLVLDEADRMLDMGFEPQIRKIVKEIPHSRQTLMFTATWPKEVKRIAEDLLVNPVQVNIGGVDELVANKSITQYVEVLTRNEKERRLEQILRSEDPDSKVIIFCSTKRMCDQLARTLSRKFGAAAIHGDKSQSERDRVLGHFRSGRSTVLVATDVASRGLDIKDIRVVINYDFPTDIEDYVHRIGRTGRAGATGVSYTFFSDQDSKYAQDLIQVLEGADQDVPPELRDMVGRGGYGRRSRRRWASSSARDKAPRGDSSFGGRGGWDLLPSGRSNIGRGVRGDGDDESRDRYYRRRDLGSRERRDTKGIVATSDRETRGRSRSHSFSPTPKRRCVARISSRSGSRSRSLEVDHSRRSRSRSISQGFNRDAGPAPRQSSPSKREPLTNNHASSPVNSRMPRHDQRQRSPYKGGEGLGEAQRDCSPGPLKDRSRRDRSHSPLKDRSRRHCLHSPLKDKSQLDHSPVRSPSLLKDRSRLDRSPVRSPSPLKDISRLDRSPSLLKDRSRFDRSPSPLKGRSRLERSPSPLKERSPGPLKDRSHSPYNCNGNGSVGFASPGQSNQKRSAHRHSDVTKGMDQERSPHHSSDDAEGVNQERSHHHSDDTGGTCQKRAHHCSDEAEGVVQISPCQHGDDADGAGKGPVRMFLSSANSREEDEEGMIPADEDDGMITRSGRASPEMKTAQEPESGD